MVISSSEDSSSSRGSFTSALYLLPLEKQQGTQGKLEERKVVGQEVQLEGAKDKRRDAYSKETGN